MLFRSFGNVSDALDGASPQAVRRPAISPVKILVGILRATVQAIVVLATLAGAGYTAWGVTRLPDHPDADISHFMHWTRLIAVRGVEQAYAGVYPETYLIYPPGSAWVYRGAIEFARLGHNEIGIEGRPGPDLRIAGRDPVEARAGETLVGEPAGAYGRGGLRG